MSESTVTNILSLADISKRWSVLKDQHITVRGILKDFSLIGKDLAFGHLYDGTTSIKHMVQIVFKKQMVPYGEKELDIETRMRADVALELTGIVIESEVKKRQEFEIVVEEIIHFGERKESEEYIWALPKIPIATIRADPVMRIRNRKQIYIQTIRSSLIHIIHDYMRCKKFKNIHTPLITFSDCEGAGEMFDVSTKSAPNFFGQVNPGLTVSGQLELEPYCCAMGHVYTFGPAFRAEHSDTSRHAAEFWMIEPEMFGSMDDVLDFTEDMLQSVCKDILRECTDELDGLSAPKDLLQKIAESGLKRMTYTEAITLLRKHSKVGKKKRPRFETEPVWGIDLSSEHEKFICEKLEGPVALTHYPQSFKSFYMRVSRDQKGPHEEPLVESFDVLVPGIGELVGGSAREEDYDRLHNIMSNKGMDLELYKWYLDLRKEGTIHHGGFGIGFERLVMLVTGIDNIRDVIPYPRTYNRKAASKLAAPTVHAT